MSVENAVEHIIWDTVSGKRLLSLPKRDYSDAAFNPQGSRIVTINRVGPFRGQHSRYIAELWDAMTGGRLRCPSGQKQDDYAVFSPDGKYLLTNTGWPDDDPALWSAVSGKKLQSFPGCDFYRATFSPDGKLILAGIDDENVKLLFSLPHEGSVNHATFSPDGTRILTLSGGMGPGVISEQTATLWDARAGKKLFSF